MLEWNVKSIKPWVALNYSAGNDTSLNSINNISQYNHKSDVINTITVTGTNLLAQIITVNQAAGSPVLSVSDNALNISSGNSKALFNIYSNTSWTVQTNQNWLIPDIDKGIDSSVMNVWAVPNQTINSRICTIIVSANGVKSIQYISPRQQGHHF